jgi:hypothetical protein
MKTHFGLAFLLLGGTALPAMASYQDAQVQFAERTRADRIMVAETMKGESRDKPKVLKGTSGGGGAGATQSKPKSKMLNPQPEPPGRR